LKETVFELEIERGTRGLWVLTRGKEAAEEEKGYGKKGEKAGDHRKRTSKIDGKSVRQGSRDFREKWRM